MNLDLINFKHDIKKSFQIETLKDKILEKIRIPKIETFRLNPELTNLVCNCVWTAVSELRLSEEAVNKKVLVLEILNNLFTFTPTESVQIQNQIEYFINHKQIKTVSVKKRLCSFISSFIKKKE